MQGLYEAFDRGAYTVVLPDARGNITEGPGFNVFVCHQGTLHTPASGVLEGITRQTVIDLAEELGIPVKLDRFGADLLETAEEVFLGSTAGALCP